MVGSSKHEGENLDGDFLGEDLRGEHDSLAFRVLKNLATLGVSVFPSKRGSQTRLSRCANDQCGKPFLRLRDGKPFLVETERVTKPGQSVSPPSVRGRQQQWHVAAWPEMAVTHS